jgi:hypothetical protein
VVALAVVWLLLRRPLSCGDIVLVIVVALLVAWMLELLQHRPEETTEGTAAAPIDEHGREPVPGAETTQASLDAIADREPAPVQQIVSQLIGLSEVTRSTGRDIVVVPAAAIPSGPSCPVVASRYGADVAVTPDSGTPRPQLTASDVSPTDSVSIRPVLAAERGGRIMT